MQNLTTKSSRPRPKSFETETRSETFETETDTPKNGSRDSITDVKSPHSVMEVWKWKSAAWIR